MSDKKQASPKPASAAPLFGKDNYLWFIGGIVAIAIGMLLMVGGKSDDPTKFYQKEIYSPVRITVAPFLIILGFCLEFVAIMKKSK